MTSTVKSVFSTLGQGNVNCSNAASLALVSQATRCCSESFRNLKLYINSAGTKSWALKFPEFDFIRQWPKKVMLLTHTKPPIKKGLWVDADGTQLSCIIF